MSEINTIPHEILKDPRLRKIIAKHGPLTVGQWDKRRTPFQSLVRSIIHQQVSGKAAESIEKKFVKLFGRFPTPKAVLAMSVPKLRSAGLSRGKVRYVKDLAEKFSDGTLKARNFPRMTNEEMIEHLTIVKGIGVWTAHMFLMFTLKRPDVLPTLDLGIRKGFQIAYGLKALPEHEEMERLARAWRQHATLASLYLWRVADAPQEKKKK